LAITDNFLNYNRLKYVFKVVYIQDIFTLPGIFSYSHQLN